MAFWSSPRASVASQTLADLVIYWQRQSGDRAMPSPGAIDPAALSAVASDLYVLAIERDPLRFRYRLVGSALRDAADRPQPGDYLDRETLLYDTDDAAYVEVARSGMPLHEEIEILRDVRRIRFERVLLPLGADGKTATAIMGAITVLAVKPIGP